MRKSKFATSLFVGIVLTAAAASQSFANQITQPEFTDEKSAYQFKEAEHKPTTLPYFGPKPILKEQPMEGIERDDSIGDYVDKLHQKHFERPVKIKSEIKYRVRPSVKPTEGEVIAPRSISEAPEHPAASDSETPKEKPIFKEQKAPFDKPEFSRNKPELKALSPCDETKEPCGDPRKEIIIVRGPVVKRVLPDNVLRPEAPVVKRIHFPMRILAQTDLKAWQFQFTGKDKVDYMKMIAVGMLNQERLPRQIQMKMRQYGWNGYYHHLLKAKTDNDRFFFEAVRAMDWAINNKRAKELWDMAIIEIIHTLNIHSTERSI